MKAVTAEGAAGIDSLKLCDLPTPTPGPGEVLLRMKAATINYRDLLFLNGGLRGMTKEPHYIPLCCAAGEVVAVAPNVTRLKLHDRVNPIYHQGWIDGEMPKGSASPGGRVDGVACEYAVFSAEDLCLIPDELGDLEAATLPCAGLTAWSAVFGVRPIKPGEWVLVQGTGGVSLAALQWAKAAGAKVAVTSSSNAKLKRAEMLGADITINYRERPDWAAACRTQLSGGGVDIVVDVVGASQLEMSASLLNQGGIVAAIGMLGGKFSWGHEVANTKIVTIIGGSRVQHDAMIAFAAKHRIRPVVDVVYDLARLQDALRRVESGDFFGKVGINLQ
jgi:NADPH:quinone reductase-like Zn-dependent oxidoreductase